MGLEPHAEHDSKLLRYAIRVAVVPCGVPSSYANEASGTPKVSKRKPGHSLRSPLDHRLELENLPPTDSKPPMK